MRTVDTQIDEIASPKERSEFLQVAGIYPELENFIISLVDDPDIYGSLPQDRRTTIEAQMDSVLSKICLP